MKRLILIILVLGLVAFAIHKHGLCPMGRRLRDAHIHDSYSFRFGRRAVEAEYRAAREAEAAARRAMDAAERAALAASSDDFHRRQAERDARETVDGIPVPIVPGSRVADASPTAPRPPASPRPPAPPRPPRRAVPMRRADAPAAIHTATGRISATEERARADALRQLREDLAARLEPQVPPSWAVADRQLEAMIVETRITPVEKPYATLYTAELDADFSEARRADLVHSYQQALVRNRMLTLAGLLVFVLICLAAVSGYIRTDEATKGYYTNRLRMLAAAGVGAAGAVIYQMIS